VQHPGRSRFGSIDSVPLRENIGASRDAHAVFVPVILA